jgi:hypothetical protein
MMASVDTYDEVATGDELVTATGARADVTRLRDRLAEIEAEQATLEAELAAFNSDYTREVVTVLAQLHETEARLLALVAIRSGERGDANAAAGAEARFRETTTAIGAVPRPAGPLPTGDLKKSFREAAKRMHPDLAPDEATRGHAEAFMKRLNHAYRAGDAAAIEDLVRQWERSPHAVAPGGPARVAALEAAVTRAQRRLDEVRDSDLAKLMERAMAATREGSDLLAEMRASAEAALAAARARLAALESAA